MGGIANGIAYHGGFIPYVGTFLTFSDYMRGSVRLAALSGLHVDLRLDPRLGRARRGRPDPPAGRALRGAPGDPEPVVRPAGRRERGGGGLGGRAASAAPSRRPGPVALSLTRQKLPTLPGTAEKAREGLAPRRLRPARGSRRRRREIDPHRHRLGAAARVRRGRGARDGRRPGSRRVAARAGSCSSARTRRTASRVLPPASARASPSRPACRSAGSAGSATRARSSGSTTSARRRRPGRSSRSSGSRSIASRASPADVLAGKVRGPDPDARARPPARAARRPPDARPRRSGVDRDVGTDPATADAPLMRVAFAADHAGAALKDELLRRLAAAGLGHELHRPRRRRLGSDSTTTRTSPRGSATRSATARPIAAS